ncbi:MAG: DUF4255 domain-containing protein [Actinomycetota bacterium]|nr:DUF4255 domain-containing protein [Actinomycetota bacterium]
MIDLVDSLVRGVIESGVINGSGAEVNFDPPTKEWSARRSTPTVNVYLYDIREESNRRAAGVVESRDDAGQVTRRRVPIRYFRLSYLLTAWTQRPEDEHRLLSALLSQFMRTPYFPPEAAGEPFASTGLPIMVNVGIPPNDERQVPEIWASLGRELKPSIDLRVVMPFDPQIDLPFGPPVTEQPAFSISAPQVGVESEVVRGRDSSDEDQEGGAGRRGLERMV